MLVGGVNQSFLIAAFDSIAGYQASVDFPTNKITNLLFNAGKLKFFEINAKLNSVGAVGTGQGFGGAGSLNIAQAFTFILPGMDAETLDFVDRIMKGNFVIVFKAKQVNTPLPGDATEARIFYYGSTQGLKATSVATGFGVADTDLVGSTITISGAQTTSGMEIVPDPTLYPSATPNAEFLTAIRQNP